VRTETCPSDQSVSVKRLAKALVTFDKSLLTTCPKSNDDDDKESTDVAPVKQNSLQKRGVIDVVRKVGVVVGLIILAPFLFIISLFVVSLAIDTAPIWLSIAFIYYAYTGIWNKTTDATA
jgi:hypothetical protein